MPGYIKLFRSLQRNPIWTAEKFTDGQAWVDLLFMSNFHDSALKIRGNRLAVPRGSIACSEETLSKKWKWSRGKVRRFVSFLVQEGMIETVQQKTKLTTLINIVNYEKYQGNDTTDSTTDSTTDGLQTDFRRTSDSTTDGTHPKKDKKEKKDKKDKNKAPLTDEEWFAALNENIAYSKLNIEVEKGKCQFWCQNNNREFTRRTFTHWLNKALTFLDKTIDSKTDGLEGSGTVEYKNPVLDKFKAEEARQAAMSCPEGKV